MRFTQTDIHNEHGLPFLPSGSLDVRERLLRSGDALLNEMRVRFMWDIKDNETVQTRVKGKNDLIFIRVLLSLNGLTPTPVRQFKAVLGPMERPIHAEGAYAKPAFEAWRCQSYLYHLGYLTDRPAAFHH